MATILRGSDLFDTNTAIGFSTNHNAATGTVTIPSGLEIGTRRLIRKIHPTQGTVTINCTGETFTRAGLASVELNADGDYWLLEKVTTTRWELVDGWNTGENANGTWVRKANGEQQCNFNEGGFNIGAGGAINRPTRNFPIAFANLFNVSNTISSSFPYDVICHCESGVTFTSYAYSFRNIGGATINNLYAGIVATGRWYL